MKYDLKFNKQLFWDYDISENDLEREDVFIFYLSRILNNGILPDVKEIPEELIREYLDRMHLSQPVRRFWEWYLGEEAQGFRGQSKEA